MTVGGRVVKKLKTKYQFVLLLFNVLSTYMRKHRACSFMLKWKLSGSQANIVNYETDR